MKERSIGVSAVIVITGIIFGIRLFYIQLINEDYKIAAENNIVQKIVEYPYRGLVYDKNDSLITINTPIYDIMVVPKEVQINDTLAFCSLLEIEVDDLKKRLLQAGRYSGIVSSVFLEKISSEKYAKIQDQLVRYAGFYVQPRIVRSFQTQSLANVLGYLGEVSPSFLKSDSTNYYRPGDYVGIGGIEKSYESDLRGKRGVSYKVANVQGIVKGVFNDGSYDTLPIPGKDIRLTIDMELQQYAEKLMNGKIGSVVALEPATGKILVLVSAPSFDPNLLSGTNIGENFRVLINDRNKPLFNRPIQAEYPPGSMFKTIQSIISLHNQVITADELIYADGKNIGDLASPGYYDLFKAITKSSNNYFYLVMRRIIQKGVESSPFLDSRIGLESWRSDVTRFGIGRKLGVDLPNESSGNIPDVDYYDRIYGVKRWKYSNIASLSIGQGELLVTPLQMANLGAIIANKGYFIAPHIVDEVGGQKNPYTTKEILPFDSMLFTPVIDGMENVIKNGSGQRGYMEGLELCGKTSTVQNPHGKDHSGFMGFAPKNEPKIAIAAYVENAGQGGRAAVSVASLLIEKYLKGEVSRKWLEKYVLEQLYKPQPVYEANISSE